MSGLSNQFGYFTPNATQFFDRNVRPRFEGTSTAMDNMLYQQAGYVQRSRRKRKGGRPLPQRAKLSKLLNSSMAPYVMRFQNLGTESLTELPFKLNYQTNITQGQQALFPFYCFDLTSMPQRTGPLADNWTYPACAYRLGRVTNNLGNDANNRYVWSPQSTIGPTLTNLTTWACERKPSRIGPCPTSLLDWIDIRLGVRGPTTRPCRVNAALVQFKREFCPPLWGTNNTTGSLTDTPVQLETLNVNDDESRAWNEFYLGLADTYISHPLNKRDSLNVKGMKILKSCRFEFNPTTSTETDARGHKQELKWFQNMNRKINYQWEKVGSVSNSASGQVGVETRFESAPNIWDTENLSFSTLSAADAIQAAPHPNARVFLMVWGESFDEGLYDATKNASFEIMVRKKHTVLSNL